MNSSELEDLDIFGSEGIESIREIRKESDFNDVNGHASPPASPSTASPTSPSFYEPLELNFDPLSPVGNGLFSSDQKSLQARSKPDIFNAVHMHVQENARIPNYNHPVDRSNSSASKPFPRNTYNSNALVASKTEQDNSMAEIFLSSESGYRKSLNQTYEVLGSLTTEDSNVQKEIDELAAVSVDPTPWSEMQDRIHIEEERNKNPEYLQTHQYHQQQQQQAVTKPTSERTTPEPTVAVINSHQGSYYPNGRQDQPSIPELLPPPETSQERSFGHNSIAGQEVSRMAEAIATAAAIARTNKVPNAVDGSTVSTENQSKAPTISSEKLYTYDTGLSNSAQSQPASTKSYFTDNGKTSTHHRYHRQRLAANQHPHAAAHVVSRASVLAAANRKNQYGFGGDHIVPSVPAPPSIRSSNQPALRKKTVRKNKQISKKTTAKTSIKPQVSSSYLPSNFSNVVHPTYTAENNSGSAYERKKQKAKDARVKLNESIERLSIAVSLAGSQSTARIEQLQNLTTTTNYRQKSITVNQEGIKLAENAKKWDRPSFVGSAASIIQSLNAQCESLMAELGAMSQMLEASKRNHESCSRNATAESEGLTRDVSTDANNNEVSGSISKQAESPTSHQMHKRHQPPIDTVKDNQSPNKRLRLVSKESKDLLSNDEVLFGSVARMLDPVSLCRCACTNKLWKEMNAFKDEKIWLNLAVKRFGFHNVRKWSENLKDGDCEEITNKFLYEEMNTSNVMPHFSQEGLSFLGNGKIQGKLSGWVFIVERSNGETLRSVKRAPSSGTSGGVGYQSRPVVELRIVVQNTGMANRPIILKPQKIGVDVSTRRRGGEFEEIDWDDRFKKNVRNLDGTIRTPSNDSLKNGSHDNLCSLGLFETAIIEVHTNARGCSTISKFRQRSNFTKILASLDGTTVPMVIPFLKHSRMF